MSQAKRNPPAGNRGVRKISDGDIPIVPASGDYYTEAAASVIGAFVAVVETPHGTPRRRVYLTLAAAEKTVLRARMDGHRASVVLCNLVPAGGAS